MSTYRRIIELLTPVLLIAGAGAVIATAAAAGGLQTSREMQLVEKAATALGGRAKVQSVTTLVMEGEGFIATVGQGMHPGAPEVGDDLHNFTRVLDFAAGRGRSQGTRAPAFVSPADPYRQIEGIDGDVAYTAGSLNDTKAARMSRGIGRTALERRNEFLLHHPIGILRAALGPAATLANRRNDAGKDKVDITIGGETLTLAVDGASGLPASVTSMAYHNNLGDIAVQTSFLEYRDVDGVKLPMRVTSTLDKYPGTDLRIAKYTVNGSTGDLTAPEAMKTAPTAAPPQNVTVEPLAPGVWALGASYYSLLVEFADHTELLEVPLNDARTLATIAKARELVPNKPLTRAITTHHHFDHTGGLRAAISEGLTIVTHEGNKAFFEELARRKHSIVPDALAKNSKPLKIETVGDHTVIKDALRTMELIHAVGNPHSDTLLVAYLPNEKILFQADMFFPTFMRQPYAPNLLELIKLRQLKVDRQVSVHGGVQTEAEVEQAIRAGT